MENLIVGINKAYILREITKKIDLFCDAIKKKNKKIEDLQNTIFHIQKERVSLAKAYARKLGVLMTIKKYNKIYGVVSNG